DHRVHPEGLARTELGVTTDRNDLARTDLLPEADVRIEQHRRNGLAPQIRLRTCLFHQLQPRDLGIRVVHRVVEMAEGVQLVMPHLDLDLKRLPLAHYSTVCTTSPTQRGPATMMAQISRQHRWLLNTPGRPRHPSGRSRDRAGATDPVTRSAKAATTGCHASSRSRWSSSSTSASNFPERAHEANSGACRPHSATVSAVVSM